MYPDARLDRARRVIVQVDRFRFASSWPLLTSIIADPAVLGSAGATRAAGCVPPV